MEFEREMMTDLERKILSANKHLVEKNSSIEKDIKTLISYIKGNKQLEKEVKEIISYYTKVKRNKYDNQSRKD